METVTTDSATAPAPLMTDADAIKREARRARDAAYKRAYRLKNPPKPPDLEAKRAYDSEWRKANREAVKAADRKYREANREAIKGAHRERYIANPDVFLVNYHRSRAKRAGTSGNITLAEMQAHREQNGQACAGCKITVKAYGKAMTIDHIVPLAKGGAHVVGNVQFLCLSCNASKRDCDPLEWARSIGRLC